MNDFNANRLCASGRSVWADQATYKLARQGAGWYSERDGSWGMRCRLVRQVGLNKAISLFGDQYTDGLSQPRVGGVARVRTHSISRSLLGPFPIFMYVRFPVDEFH